MAPAAHSRDREVCSNPYSPKTNFRNVPTGCPRPYVLAVEKKDARTLASFMLWEEEEEGRKLPDQDEIEKEKAEGDAMIQMEADTVAIS
jgi:hypothetical protein